MHRNTSVYAACRRLQHRARRGCEALRSDRTRLRGLAPQRRVDYPPSALGETDMGGRPTLRLVGYSVAGSLRALLTLLLPHNAVSQTTLRPPVTPACVSSPFGWRHAVDPHAPAGFHNGVDLPAP